MKATISAISFILVAFASATFVNGAVQCCQQDSLNQDPLCTFNSNQFDRADFSIDYCVCDIESNDTPSCIDCCIDKYRDNRDASCGAGSLDLLSSHNGQLLSCSEGCLHSCQDRCHDEFIACLDQCDIADAGFGCSTNCISNDRRCTQICDISTARVNGFREVL